MTAPTRGSVSPGSRTFTVSASSTTWALVTISPSEVTMTPVPADSPVTAAVVDHPLDGDDRRAHLVGDRGHVDDTERLVARRAPT